MDGSAGAGRRALERERAQPSRRLYFQPGHTPRASPALDNLRGGCAFSARLGARSMHERPPGAVVPLYLAIRRRGRGGRRVVARRWRRVPVAGLLARAQRAAHTLFFICWRLGGRRLRSPSPSRAAPAPRPPPCIFELTTRAEPIPTWQILVERSGCGLFVPHPFFSSRTSSFAATLYRPAG
jgi:hypothetical protein